MVVADKIVVVAISFQSFLKAKSKNVIKGKVKMLLIKVPAEIMPKKQDRRKYPTPSCDGVTNGDGFILNSKLVTPLHDGVHFLIDLWIK